MKLSYGFIYCWLNTINGKRYFGKDSYHEGLEGVRKRYKSGVSGIRRRLKRGKQSRLIIKALNKYGFDNFVLTIVRRCYSLKVLNKAEKHFIRKFKTNVCRYGSKFGYNLTDGGDGSSGIIPSKETRKKMSKSQIRSYKETDLKEKRRRAERISKANSGKKHWSYGKKQSQETIEKRRKTNSDGRLAGKNNPRYGIHVSKETRLKRSVTMSDGRRKGKNHPRFRSDLNRSKIKELYQTGNYTLSNLADFNKVVKSTIYEIVKEY